MLGWLLKWLYVDEGRSVEHDGVVLVGDGRPESADGLIRPNLEHLDLSGDLVTGAYRGFEAPINMEENAAGTRQIFGDYYIEQT